MYRNAIPVSRLDPYMESYTEWHGLHTLLIAQTVTELKPDIAARPTRLC